MSVTSLCYTTNDLSVWKTSPDGLIPELTESQIQPIEPIPLTKTLIKPSSDTELYNKYRSIKTKQFTCQVFTSNNKLTKQYSINSSSGLNTTAIANMTQGTAESLKLKVSEFADMLDGLSDSQAIAISNHELASAVKIATKAQQNPPEGILSRTIDHFPFDRGLGLICFDFDFDENNPTLSIDEAKKVLYTLIPETKHAAMLARYSSSSYIKQISTGEFLTENKGLHIYCWSNHLKDMHGLGNKLLHQAWLKGMGYLKISSAGSILQRCVIDTAVFSPERLVFEANPIMGEDLIREAPESVFFDGGVLDLKSTAGRKLSTSDKSEVLRLQAVAEAEPIFKKQQETISAAYMKKEVDKLCKFDSELSRSEAIVSIESRKTGVLMLEDVLVFDDAGEVSIREVMDNLLAFDGKTLADPLEPDKGRCKAKFYANTDTNNPQIHSFVHGGQIFSFKDSEELEQYDEFLMKHASGTVSGKFRIAKKENNLVVFGSKADLTNTHEGTFHGSEPIAKAWCKDPGRNKFEGVDFLPVAGRMQSNELFIDKGILNLYSGVTISPMDGDCELILGHIKEVWCAGNVLLHTYVINWLARMVQYPEKIGETVIVLKSIPGAGKDTITKILADYFGEHGVMVASSDRITGRFNSHIGKAVFLSGNESFWGGNKSSEGQLKSLITDPTQRVEYKGLESIEMRSCLHFIFNTNEDWSVPVALDDRRFICIDVSDHRVGDVDYFNALHKQTKSQPGRAAFIHYLMNLDISTFNVRVLPDVTSQSMRNNKLMSADSPIQWIAECIELKNISDDKKEIASTMPKEGCIEYGTPFPAAEDWNEEIVIPKKELYRAYTDWCKHHRNQYVKPVNIFFKGIAKLGDQTRLTIDGERTNCLKLLSVDECSKKLEELLK